MYSWATDIDGYQSLPDKPIPRILFLRSNAQSSFSGFVASGLENSLNIEFEQFPKIASDEWIGIEKVYDPDEALCHLNQHLVANREELKNKIESGSYDLVLLLDYDGRLFSYQQMNPLKKWRNILGHFKNFFQLSPAQIIQNIKLMQGVPLTLKKINSMVPVVVVDMDDWICLPPAGQHFLKHCTYYYKRELPFNRFFLYYQQRPAPWRKRRKEISLFVKKARNMPLGIEDKKYYYLKGKRVEMQDIDIFYCSGATSTLRLKAKKELKKMASDSSWNIVIADSLPFEEYCKIMARSKITVSISGGGWDCFRHYEAIALGSIPFMDTPIIDTPWCLQFRNNIFFSNTFADFRTRLEKLLSNLSLCSDCFISLEKNVETKMLHSKIVEGIVANSLQQNECLTKTIK